MKYLQYCTYVWFEVGDFINYSLLRISINNYKFIFMFWNIVFILLLMLIFFRHLKCTSGHFLSIACLFNLWVLFSLHAQSEFRCLFERSGVTIVWLKIQFFLGCDAVFVGQAILLQDCSAFKMSSLVAQWHSIIYLMTGFFNFLLTLVLWTNIYETGSMLYVNDPVHNFLMNLVL
jgi:hypothetical protein